MYTRGDRNRSLSITTSDLHSLLLMSRGLGRLGPAMVSLPSVNAGYLCGAHERGACCTDEEVLRQQKIPIETRTGIMMISVNVTENVSIGGSLTRR